MQHTIQDTLVLVKPHATHLADSFARVFNQAGMSIIDRQPVTVTRNHALQMVSRQSRHSDPLKFELNAGLLAQGGSILWLVRGEDAVETCRALKALIRERIGTDQLRTLLHTADSVNEAEGQRDVLLAPAPIVSAGEEQVTSQYCGHIDRLLRDEYRQTHVAPGATPGPFTMQILDDPVHGVDDIIRALSDHLPELSQTQLVDLAFATKRLGSCSVTGLDAVLAGTLWHGIAERHFLQTLVSQ